jgi:hypothetical protein
MGSLASGLGVRGGLLETEWRMPPSAGSPAGQQVPSSPDGVAAAEAPQHAPSFPEPPPVELQAERRSRRVITKAAGARRMGKLLTDSRIPRCGMVAAGFNGGKQFRS